MTERNGTVYPEFRELELLCGAHERVTARVADVRALVTAAARLLGYQLVPLPEHPEAIANGARPGRAARTCPDCGRHFSSAQGIGRHRAWAHGYKGRRRKS